VIVDEARRHYQKLWGEPSRQASFRVMGHEIEVCKWDAARNPEQVNIYATVGASAQVSPGRDPKHCEAVGDGRAGAAAARY